MLSVLVLMAPTIPIVRVHHANVNATILLQNKKGSNMGFEKDFEKLAELSEKGTDRWWVYDKDYETICSLDKDDISGRSITGCYDVDVSDGELIAASRNALPMLLEIIEHLRVNANLGMKAQGFSAGYFDDAVDRIWREGMKNQ